MLVVGTQQTHVIIVTYFYRIQDIISFLSSKWVAVERVLAEVWGFTLDWKCCVGQNPLKVQYTKIEYGGESTSCMWYNEDEQSNGEASPGNVGIEERYL